MTIATELAARRSVVLATIVRDSGSVPRRTGTKMLIFPDGTPRGTVGGGIFELLVIRDGMAALKRGRSITHTYSFNPKGVDVDAFGAVCGGKADVFLEVLMPADRLMIVGGGHCGRALARAASLLDFSLVVADDRAEFARAEDFAYANVESVLHLPGDFAGLPEADERTYVLLVSKGFLTDEAALRRVIGSPAAYIGMIGSLRKRQAVYEKLKADGITDEQLARVHAPIGLEIGAESPEEIAISILAEVIKTRSAHKRRAGEPDDK
ncbi:MAG TPA: XdhC/CoxI family protein [Tepidisphaeraceae bacterium]|nr:XdhC/CoxI family protein [Tepidisphaeraceae bacterium]